MSASSEDEHAASNLLLAGNGGGAGGVETSFPARSLLFPPGSSSQEHEQGVNSKKPRVPPSTATKRGGFAAVAGEPYRALGRNPQDWRQLKELNDRASRQWRDSGAGGQQQGHQQGGTTSNSGGAGGAGSRGGAGGQKPFAGFEKGGGGGATYCTAGVAAPNQKDNSGGADVENAARERSDREMSDMLGAILLMSEESVSRRSRFDPKKVGRSCVSSRNNRWFSGGTGRDSRAHVDGCAGRRGLTSVRGALTRGEDDTDNQHTTADHDVGDATTPSSRQKPKHSSFLHNILIRPERLGEAGGAVTIKARRQQLKILEDADARNQPLLRSVLEDVLKLEERTRQEQVTIKFPEHS